ncbi:MAG: hypothetical protein GBAus27B_000422 [Mycoplasmataceae bacterium]|nr:MAG: hypothetical protein GBAus27B_000422 [Mycoplasmataceae bacterium]
MTTLIILSFLGGISFSLFLSVLFLRLVKVNCPKCKELKSVWEIAIFCWKERIISGQSCQKCQKLESQTDIDGEIEL